MATFSKQFLSAAGANNAPISVTSASILLHLPTTVASEKDEMWIWINNPNATTSQVRLFWFNGSTGSTITIVEVPAYTSYLVLAGIPMNSPNASSGVYGTVLVGSNVIAVGYVNRIA